MKIDSYGAPLMITWQMTRDCDLACVHCLTDSAPGRALPGELSRAEAMEIVSQFISSSVPYVMLVGGEPTLVPHFLEVAEALGKAGVWLKIETNGQNLGEETCRRLSALPIRSIQISIDGATQSVYGKVRPGASLEKTLKACRGVRSFGMPLEITFAPTRANISDFSRVAALALELGAFRLNTGRLMRLGTAAKLWDRVEPTCAQYEEFLATLRKTERDLAGRLELCYLPWTLKESLLDSLNEAPGTLLVLPDGRVKVAGGLPFICGDLKKQTLGEVWDLYRNAWKTEEVKERLNELTEGEAFLADANNWRPLKKVQPCLVGAGPKENA